MKGPTERTAIKLTLRQRKALEQFTKEPQHLADKTPLPVRLTLEHLGMIRGSHLGWCLTEAGALALGIADTVTANTITPAQIDAVRKAMVGVPRKDAHHRAVIQDCIGAANGSKACLESIADVFNSMNKTK